MHVHTENKARRAIEAVSSGRALRGIPDGAFLALAGGAFATAVVLRLFGKKDTATFVSEWAPAILLLGIYNKITSLEKTGRRAATP
jgi:hypothetical protein